MTGGIAICQRVFSLLADSHSATMRTIQWLLVGVLLFVSPLPLAIDSFKFSLGELSGPGWQVGNLILELEWQEREAQQTSFKIVGENISTEFLSNPIDKISLHCSHGEVSDTRIACSKGKLSVTHPILDKPLSNIRFNWNNREQSIDINVDNLSVFSGRINLNWSQTKEDWSTKVTAQGITLQTLNQFLSLDVKYDYSGLADLQIDAGGRSDRVQKMDWSARMREIAFSDAAGEILGEGIAIQWQGAMQQKGGYWHSRQSGQISRGEILSPYFYLSTESSPVLLTLENTFSSDFSKMSFSNLNLKQEKGFQISGAGDLSLFPELIVSKLNISLDPTELETLFTENIQPVVAETAWEQLQIKGAVSAQIEWANKHLAAASLTLEEVDIATKTQDEEGSHDSITLSKVDATLVLNPAGENRVSRLSWKEGHLLKGLSLGPAELVFSLAEDNLKLLDTTELPILDGSLVIEALEWQQQQGAKFRGFIKPISMASISEALEWPPLSGQLSGMIPDVKYQNGLFSIDGVTLIKIFDGNILIKELKLEDPLGVWPVLLADIEMNNLDLEQLTQTFAFGKITGRLEGKAEQLRLEKWEPVSFISSFQTPPGDRSRHRISQRAVDNISNLGGVGISGALSRSFLGMFEEFSYDRLGISCELKDGICTMGGVAPAKQGYYLVKGGGIPRIDIVGYNRRTDWDVLIRKLSEITTGGEPVIQ